MNIIKILKENNKLDTVDLDKFKIESKIYNSIDSSIIEELNLSNNIIYYAGIKPKEAASSDSLDIDPGFNPITTYKKFEVVRNTAIAGGCTTKFIKGFPIDDDLKTYIHIAIFSNCCAYYFEYETLQQNFDVGGILTDSGMVISKDYAYKDCEITPETFGERIDEQRLSGHVFKIPVSVAIEISNATDASKAKIFNDWLITNPQPPSPIGTKVG